MIILISILIFAFIVSLIFVFVKRKKIASKFLLGPSARYEIRFHKVKEKRKRYHPHIVYGKKVDRKTGEVWLKSVPTSHDSLSINGKKPLKLMRNVNEKHDLDHKNRTRENVSYVIPKKYFDRKSNYSPRKKGYSVPRGDARRVKKYLKELD